VAVGALASSIVKGPDWGWVSVGDVASFVVAAAALIFVRRQDGPSSVAGHRTGAVASADFRVVEPDVDSNGRSAQSVHLFQHLVGDPADRLLAHRGAVDLGEVRADLSGGQSRKGARQAAPTEPWAAPPGPTRRSATSYRTRFDRSPLHAPPAVRQGRRSPRSHTTADGASTARPPPSATRHAHDATPDDAGAPERCPQADRPPPRPSARSAMVFRTV
jgi:hypothetical protein